MSGLATRRAIYGAMAGDSTLTNLLGTPAPGYAQSIYHQLAPTEANFPYIVFHRQASTPTYTFKTGAAAMDTEVWTIKGVDRNTTADKVDNIAARLDALLTDGTVTISGRLQMYLRRDSDIDLSETVDGKRYVHAGCLFRLVHQPT